MASEEQKALALFIKEVHSALRRTSLHIGPNKAWLEHVKNTDVLENYAACMNKLATTYWDANSAKDCNDVVSRIEWSAAFCLDYFVNKLYLKYREKDIQIGSKILCISVDTKENFGTPIQLIDVGSCYNPFKIFDFLSVFPIDLCPANDGVFQCDILSVNLGSKTELDGTKVVQLQVSSFDVVTFCFVLEYIPDSKLRIEACVKAYDLLKPGGLLIINTPDSKHVGANFKIMKCWRYTLAHIGFSRIKYEKFKHMHCMAFRKSIHKDIAVRWAKLHKEPYMEYTMNIPQDFCHTSDIKNFLSTKTVTTFDDLKELPFCDDIVG
ncbi:unnamed protein product [Diatraea saccharalis]|uniref:S-adenosylmethionine sensor upstream of mTORC1 n=1 Tax=Diatraea saccharalis TaxID=40085 RepID=A0A9N9RA26_9NEOP|nr:unnamed protein product [Diatraea saccharalis]